MEPVIQERAFRMKEGPQRIIDGQGQMELRNFKYNEYLELEMIGILR